MENKAQAAQRKSGLPRLLWLRFPLLAALLVNLVLVLRVPVQQFAPGNQSLEQLAWAAIGGSKTDVPRGNNSRSQPDGTFVGPSGIANPASSASRPPRHDEPGGDNITPAVRWIMAGLGDQMAQATAARQRQTGEFAEQFALAIVDFSQSKRAVATPPDVAIAPPAATITPPVVAVAPPRATPPRGSGSPLRTTLAQSNQGDEPPVPPQTTNTRPQPVTRPPQPTPPLVKVDILLENSADSKNVFHLVLDNQVISLNPGQQHRVNTSGPHVVRFHRGASFGYGEQVLRNGMYQFRVGKEGWEIVKTADVIKTY